MNRVVSKFKKKKHAEPTIKQKVSSRLRNRIPDLVIFYGIRAGIDKLNIKPSTRHPSIDSDSPSFVCHRLWPHSLQEGGLWGSELWLPLWGRQPSVLRSRGAAGKQHQRHCGSRRLQVCANHQPLQLVRNRKSTSQIMHSSTVGIVGNPQVGIVHRLEVHGLIML